MPEVDLSVRSSGAVRSACFPRFVLKVTQEHIDRAFKIARWYGRRARRAEISDLESAALEGLAKAARDWIPDDSPPPNPRTGRQRSFWNFAFIKILGEMRDELRRFDHLTRDQRALVVQDEGGGLALTEEGLDWIDPQEPVSLDASFTAEDGQDTFALVDLIKEPRDPIEAFELRDAVCRAGAPLTERTRFIFVKTEVEGYSNSEIADAFGVTEGRASQLRGAAFDKMRREIGDSFLDAA
jgi:RNA polymerase sigma factor (sigma-70 family)